MMRIAIIGAGMGGLTLASELGLFAKVTVFEKSRGLGGRMATRRAGTFSFDHGTQFFTARSPAFAEFLAPLIASGHVAEWSGKLVYLEPDARLRKRLWFEPHFVGCPGMSGLCRLLAQGVTVEHGIEVAPLGLRARDGWHLQSQAGGELGCFDWVISTAPAPQTACLFDAHLPADAALRGTAMHACFALMVGFARPWDQTWIAGKARDNPLEWIAVNSTRPGRERALTSIVAHARADWSDTHLDVEPSVVQAKLVAEFSRLTGIDTAAADHLALHRWRYALAEPREEPVAPLLDPGLQIGACGDWCTASRIEDVWTAAMQLATDWRAIAN